LAAADASSVLSTASALMLKAIDVHPKLKEKLWSYRGEMSKAKRVVDLIFDQEALQTSGVVAGTRMLESHGKILKSDLMSLGEGKGTITASARRMICPLLLADTTFDS
jgi:hypothetical protein